MSKALKLFNILIADGDPQMGKVFQKTLEDMGFPSVTLTQSGQRALELLNQKSYDLLITEWDLQKMNGLELVQLVRGKPNSPDVTLPVIMLTGRAEQADVMTARNAGVNEYVRKPFTAKTVFNRLERLIQNPKHFIVSPEFVGPDRRNAGAPTSNRPDKRTAILTPQLKPKNPGKELYKIDAPKVWVVDYAFTRKLGKGVSLSSVITPEALHQAQESINAITDESLVWIRGDLQLLRALREQWAAGGNDSDIRSQIGEVALKLSGRAGTFGYDNAAQVGYILHLFCRQGQQLSSAMQQLIIEKHVSVMQIALGNSMNTLSPEKMAMVIEELENLTRKFS